MTSLSPIELLITFVALALGVMLWRFLPFLLFSRRERPPAVVLRLGGTLPHAAMSLLLVYCLKDVNPAAWPHGLPELAGIACTGALHLWRGNFLLSIAGGVFLHMFLVQAVF